ncbi:MAG TPA: DNA ligase D [Acidobacteriota bacterium]|nr:DNA ligase D [Acidobacteriota bacterium]
MPSDHDKLKEYREKRSPESTPEPFGGGGPKGRFVVQKHDASRLHYDLRLEWGGVLHSWAVPKGPSPDPSDKRAAFETEDHPLGYADFEGIIPEGNYGAGPMIVWDQGLWSPKGDPDEGLKEGKLHFELKGYKMRGGWELIRPREEKPTEWLLFKKRDALAGDPLRECWTEESVFSAITVEELRDGHQRSRPIREMLQKWDAPRLEGPPPGLGEVPLMLAQPGGKPFSDPGWCFEMKYDGYRILAFKQGTRGRLQYRKGGEATRLYPAVARMLGGLPYSSLVADGEIVVLDEQARPSFQRLQQRAMLGRSADILRADVEHPALLYLFDLLIFEDFDLRPLPYLKRKDILSRIVPKAGPLRFAHHIPEKGEQLFAHIESLGVEGLIAKREDAPYTAGRSSDWVKIRAEKHQDCVIVGYVHPKSGTRSGFASLELGVYEGGDLRYAGSVGTGFSGKLIDQIQQLLKPLERDETPCSGDIPKARRTWVEPHLVCRVRFTEWTGADNLRQPVFEKLVPEAKPENCLREHEGEPEEPPAPTNQERKVPFSNRDKVFWPEEGYTKGDLIDYYQAVTPWLMPYLSDRPLVLTRYPDGIRGKYFFQKNAPDYLPDWVRTERIWSQHAEREIDHIVCDNPETLLYLANLGTIPLHVWSSRFADLAHPDWSIIDLDPKEAPFEDVITLARAFHDLCREIDLPAFCKTSGSSGLHVLIPLAGLFTYQQSRSLAELLARVVAMENSGIATLFRSLDKRQGKVFLDTGQNGHGKLLVAPFSVRPLPLAPVSCPLRWDEVKPGLKITDFHISNMPERLKSLGDPLSDILRLKPDFAQALNRLSQRQKRS